MRSGADGLVSRRRRRWMIDVEGAGGIPDDGIRSLGADPVRRRNGVGVGLGSAGGEEGRRVRNDAGRGDGI